MTEVPPPLHRPWDRQPAEPNLWFDRFERFRMRGPRRSVLSVYQDEREKAGKGRGTDDVPKAWTKACATWRWRERAEAWDEAERQRQRAEEEHEREAERDLRLTMLWTTRQMLARRLQALLQDPAPVATMSPMQLMRAMVQLFQQQRIEYGQDARRLEISGPDRQPVRQEVQHDLSNMTPEIAAKVLELRRLMAEQEGRENDDYGAGTGAVCPEPHHS